METRTHSDKPTTATTMTKFRKLAITMLAAVTVAVGSLTIVPAARAEPMSCQQKQSVVNGYWALGWMYYSIGAYAYAYYWWGKAEGLAEGGC